MHNLPNRVSTTAVHWYKYLIIHSTAHRLCVLTTNLRLKKIKKQVKVKEIFWGCIHVNQKGVYSSLGQVNFFKAVLEDQYKFKQVCSLSFSFYESISDFVAS